MKRQKPGSAAFNNSTKFGVDVLDQPARQYSTKSASRNCPLQVFFNILVSFLRFILHREYKFNIYNIQHTINILLLHTGSKSAVYAVIESISDVSIGYVRTLNGP
jgi:hypothetical protein